MSHDSRESESGSSQFVGGLVIGTVLGMAGYYFFGTEAGKKNRAVLQKKWQHFAEAAAAAEKKNPQLSTLLKSGLQRVAAELGAADWDPDTKLSQTKPKLTPLRMLKPERKLKTPRAKFKGS
jgi:gas vesicle protein